MNLLRHLPKLLILITLESNAASDPILLISEISSYTVSTFSKDSFLYGNLIFENDKSDSLSNEKISVTLSRSCIKSGELIRLKSEGCNFKTSWNLPNGSEIGGKSIETYIPGEYRVSCVNETGFIDKSQKVIVEECHMSIPDIDITSTSISHSKPIFASVKCLETDTVIWVNPFNKVDTLNSADIYLVRNHGAYQINCTKSGDFYKIHFDEEEPSFSIKAQQYFLDNNKRTTLFASGCYNGSVTWKIDSIIKIAPSIDADKPGIYEASCQGDSFIDAGNKIIQIFPSPGKLPSLGQNSRYICPNEPVKLYAFCQNKESFVEWRLLRKNIGNDSDAGLQYDYYTGTNITVKGPGVYWARCVAKDSSFYGNFELTPVIVESIFPENFLASNSSVISEMSCLDVGDKITLGVPSMESLEYRWYNPAGSMISNQPQFQILADVNSTSGFYRLTAFQKNQRAISSCTYSDSTKVQFSLKPIIDSLTSNSPLKTHDLFKIKLYARNFESSEWTGPNNFHSLRSEPEIRIMDNTFGGKYQLLLKNEQGCENKAVVNLEISNCIARIKALDSLTGKWEDHINLDRNGEIIPVTLYLEGNESGSLFETFEIQWIDRYGQILSKNASVSVTEPGSYYVKLSKGEAVCRDVIQLERENPFDFNYTTNVRVEFPEGNIANLFSFTLSKFISPVFFLQKDQEYYLNIGLYQNFNKFIEYTHLNTIECEHLLIIPELNYITLNPVPEWKNFTGVLVRKDAEEPFDIRTIEKYSNGEFVENLSNGEVNFNDSSVLYITQWKDFRLSRSESSYITDSFNCDRIGFNTIPISKNWLCDYFEKVDRGPKVNTLLPLQSPSPFFSRNDEIADSIQSSIIDLDLISIKQPRKNLLHIPPEVFLVNQDNKDIDFEELIISALKTSFIKAEQDVSIENCNQLELLLVLTKDSMNRHLSKWGQIEMSNLFDKEKAFDNYLKLKNNIKEPGYLDDWLKDQFKIKRKN